MIRNLKRRELLAGILGIPAGALGLSNESPPHIAKTPLEINHDRMTLIENELTTRWDVYHTGGTLRAYRGLKMWIEEVNNFARDMRSNLWHERANAVLCMGYQLQGSVFRDMLDYKQAHSAYQQAYRIAQEINDPEFIAAALAREGVTYIQENNPLEAIDYLNEALRCANGLGLPTLRGYILQALSEAYAIAQEPTQCWRAANLAERALQNCGEVPERSNCTPNTSSVMAQKGVDAVLLHDYERAIALLDKSLRTYNRAYVRGRARLMAQKAEAYLGLQRIDECTDTALEAFALADSAGSSKTIQRLQKLYETLSSSRWKRESGVLQLGSVLAGEHP
ncbi:MAG TPA: tetratricopeptide repeat protein [Ktedonobacteraceae bacterium]|nr:tetratricopeptide repeat protein [Ktedonobacteraceae bacterium]